MESVIESPLDVLSRAATMVQRDSPMHGGDPPEAARGGTAIAPPRSPPPAPGAPAQHLSRAKWRREKRQRLSAPSGSSSGGGKATPGGGIVETRPPPPSTAAKLYLLVPLSVREGKPATIGNPAPARAADGASPESSEGVAAPSETEEDAGRDGAAADSGPLDMRRPHPPMEETGCTVQPPRPSVITCAPGRAPPSPPRAPSPPPSDANPMGHRREMISGDSCDPVIDEHFRRSLGNDYDHLFSPKGVPSSSSLGSGSTATPGPTARGEWDPGSSVTITGTSVDDHFAKALGETWLKLQAAEVTKEGKSGDHEQSPPHRSAATTPPQRRGLVWCPPTEGLRRQPPPVSPQEGTWEQHLPCGKPLH